MKRVLLGAVVAVVVVGLLVLGLCAIRARAAAGHEVKTLGIGEAAPDFELPGVDGKTYSLKDFAAAKVLVVVFTCNHCPTAQAYEKRIIQMAADYKDKGVALVAIKKACLSAAIRA